jgi:hypothetical protein
LASSSAPLQQRGLVPAFGAGQCSGAADSPAKIYLRPLRIRIIRPFIGSMLEILWLASLSGVLVIVSWGMAMSLLSPRITARTAQTYSFGDFIDFRKDGNAGPYLREGWTKADENGTTTAGPVADIVLPVELPDKQDLVFEIEGRPRFATGDRSYWVTVLANGRQFANWNFVSNNHNPSRSLARLPLDFVKANRPLHITFVVGSDHPAPDAPYRKDFSGYQIEMFRIRLR